MKTKFKIPIYRGKLTVIQVNDLSSIADKYNLGDVSEMNGITFMTKNKTGIPEFVVAFEGKTKPSIIAHESLHVVTMIFNDIHARLDMDNEEPQCYLLSWIVDSIHSVVKLKK